MEEIEQTISGPTEEQMEMTTMMTMMMDKFPELHTTPYNDVVTYDHQLNNNLFPINTPYFVDTPHTFLPPTPYFPSSTNIPFPNTEFQDHIPPPPQIDWLNNKINKNTTTSNMAAMREMIFRIAAMQPIHIDPESVKPPKRRNVKISKDPQSVAARHRREKISERIRILQRLVPGGTKMDTASMLDEAIHYVKFLKTQIQSLERASSSSPSCCSSTSGVPVAGSYHFPSLGRGFQDVEYFGDA